MRQRRIAMDAVEDVQASTRDLLREYGKPVLGTWTSEDWFEKILCSCNYKSYRRQWRVVLSGRRFRLDFAFPDAKLAIEIDGSEHKSNPKTIQRDKDLAESLQEEGWTLLRFTVSEIHHEVRNVRKTVREALLKSSCA